MTKHIKHNSVERHVNNTKIQILIEFFLPLRYHGVIRLIQTAAVINDPNEKSVRRTIKTTIAYLLYLLID